MYISIIIPYTLYYYTHLCHHVYNYIIIIIIIAQLTSFSPPVPSLHPITSSSCIHPTANGYQSPIVYYYEHKSKLPYYPSASSCAVPMYPVHHHTVKGKKHYSANEVRYLETVFAAKNYVLIGEGVKIARRIGVFERQVKVWFQDR